MLKKLICQLCIIASLLLIIYSFFASNNDLSLPNQEISPDLLYEGGFLTARRYILIDTRQRADFELGHIPGSYNDPDCSLHKADPLITYAPTLIIFKSSHREQEILLKCKKKYRRSRILSGGLEGWSNQGYPLRSGSVRIIDTKKTCGSPFGKTSDEDCL